MFLKILFVMLPYKLMSCSFFSNRLAVISQFPDCHTLLLKDDCFPAHNIMFSNTDRRSDKDICWPQEYGLNVFGGNELA